MIWCEYVKRSEVKREIQGTPINPYFVNLEKRFKATRKIEG